MNDCYNFIDFQLSSFLDNEVLERLFGQLEGYVIALLSSNLWSINDCLLLSIEKWRKVRDERNKAREESRNLSNKLESICKELYEIKRQKSDLELEVEALQQQIKELNLFCNSNTNNESIISVNQDLQVLDKKPSFGKYSTKYSNSL